MSQPSFVPGGYAVFHFSKYGRKIYRIDSECVRYRFRIFHFLISFRAYEVRSLSFHLRNVKAIFWKPKNEKSRPAKRKTFRRAGPYTPTFLLESTLFLFFHKAVQYRRGFCAGRMSLRVKQIIVFTGKQSIANLPNPQSVLDLQISSNHRLRGYPRLYSLHNGA